MTASGRTWRNRGLHSLPLARTWLPFGDVQPLDDLRATAYRRPLGAEEDEAWEQLLPQTEVRAALDAPLR